MTELKVPVRRKTNAMVRDGGRLKALAITIYPNGTIGLRPHKTRREEILTLESAYGLAIKQRVAREQAEKAVTKKARRKR